MLNGQPRILSIQHLRVTFPNLKPACSNACSTQTCDNWFYYSSGVIVRDFQPPKSFSKNVFICHVCLKDNHLHILHSDAVTKSRIVCVGKISVPLTRLQINIPLNIRGRIRYLIRLKGLFTTCKLACPDHSRLLDSATFYGKGFASLDRSLCKISERIFLEGLAVLDELIDDSAHNYFIR